MPLPRDETTAKTVDSLRAFAQGRAALERGRQRARRVAKGAGGSSADVEATGYKPLLAEVLILIGVMQCESAPHRHESSWRNAYYAAEASRDDITAAKACSSLASVVGDSQDPQQESDRWANLAHAILDRIASPQKRIRAWVFHNTALTRLRQGDAAAALTLFEQALTLKEEALGRNHPDVGRTTSALVWVMTAWAPEEALATPTRSLRSARSWIRTASTWGTR